MTSEDDSREHGVEFGPLADDLQSESYPQEKSELLSEYGAREVDLEDGTQTLQAVLGPLGGTTYSSAEEVMRGVVGNVDDGAIGRKNYTDRGGGRAGEEERAEESL